MTTIDRIGETAARLQRGVDAQIAGRAAEAERIYLEILASDPHLAQARNLVGLLRLDAGLASEAGLWLRQALVLEPANASFHGHYGNVLTASRIPEAAATVYGRAVSLSPDDPSWLYNLGGAEMALGRNASAVLWFRRCLQLRPLYGAAWNNLALALSHQGDATARDVAWRCAIATEPALAEVLGNLAVASLQQDDGETAERLAGRALAVGPLQVDALNTLGAARLTRNDTDFAGSALRLAISLKPDMRDAHYNLGIVRMAEGQPFDAVSRQKRALAIDPAYAEAEWNKALALLLAGEFTEGWQAYESRWRMRSFPTARRDFTQPEWDGAPLEGRTLLVHAEQGHGDTIQFARYLPLLEQRGARLVVECQPALKRLVAQLPCVAEVIAQGEALPKFDRHVPFLGLPRLFGTRLETVPSHVPYLALPPRRIAQSAANGSKTISIGLAWAGSPGHRRDKIRSLPLDAARHLVQALTALGGVRLLSLQKNGRSEDFDGQLLSVLRESDDFLETAIITNDLDLVLSVDTAVAHLAGALAKPGLVLLPSAPDFRWLLGRRDSPWYPTLELLRQPSPNAWIPVISAVIARVGAILSRDPSKGLPPLLLQ